MKEKLINSFARHPTDKGSPEIQIAILTERIRKLGKHFAVNKKDNNSKRGFLILIGKRKKLLRYLRKTNEEKYKEMLKRLKMRR